MAFRDGSVVHAFHAILLRKSRSVKHGTDFDIDLRPEALKLYGSLDVLRIIGGLARAFFYAKTAINPPIIPVNQNNCILVASEGVAT